MFSLLRFLSEIQIEPPESTLNWDMVPPSSLRANSTLGNKEAPLMNLTPCPGGSLWRRCPGVMATIIRLITPTLDRCGDSATG